MAPRQDPGQRGEGPGTGVFFFTVRLFLPGKECTEFLKLERNPPPSQVTEGFVQQQHLTFKELPGPFVSQKTQPSLQLAYGMTSALKTGHFCSPWPHDIQQPICRGQQLTGRMDVRLGVGAVRWAPGRSAGHPPAQCARPPSALRWGVGARFSGPQKFPTLSHQGKV